MKLSLLLSALSPAWAHFVLQIPTSLGFDDDAEADSPCGGFNATDRTNVTNFPIKGGAVGVLTTNLNVALSSRRRSCIT
ncbi:hypothetical protein GQ53DRAFT_756110 [Thozetella sp. PMI_491]|nr:hypothetical protein GQ53DRAFT_756110 [Thozetella sp. PMI_491]